MNDKPVFSDLGRGKKQSIVCKASPIGHDDIPDAEILIVKTVPEFKDLPQAAEFYDNDAQDIFDRLTESLPGGTLARLTAKLLNHQASKCYFKIQDK